MLTALLDGRALIASELAYAARINPQTASAHLAKLTQAGLLTALREGRHRYFRLASPKIFEMLDSIKAIAVESRPQFRPLSRQARELSDARICYDHLAGRLSVDIADFFTWHEYIVRSEESSRNHADRHALSPVAVTAAAVVRAAEVVTRVPPTPVAVTAAAVIRAAVVVIRVPPTPVAVTAAAVITAN
jgi:DNA-binding transcriptional ArsR family regulator